MLHRLDGLVGPAGAARRRKPGPPDRRIGAGAAASSQPAGRLVPSAAFDGEPGLAEPDAVVLRCQLAGLLQGLLQPVVRQPLQIEVAEILQVADRVVGLREMGSKQRFHVIEPGLDLIDLAEQAADPILVRASSSGQALLEPPLGRVKPAL